MAYTDYTPQQASEIAKSIYERDLRADLEREPGNIGKYVVLNIENGDYEVGDDPDELSSRFHARQPEATLFRLRIGYRAAAKIGRGWDALRQ